VGGRELMNGYSELNDPADQRARFTAQAADREAGDTEAQPMDAAYCDALGYGLPPAAGCGVGIDRLVMLFTGKTTIREVLLYPLMKPL
jgi:lysyl-tRNA synthetase class 2